jgi:hypothetical protein
MTRRSVKGKTGSMDAHMHTPCADVSCHTRTDGLAGKHIHRSSARTQRCELGHEDKCRIGWHKPQLTYREQLSVPKQGGGFIWAAHSIMLGIK